MIDNEYDEAYKMVLELVDDYLDRHAVGPTVVYVSDNEDLQSMIMWAAQNEGYEIKRTEDATYCTHEG